MEDDNHLIDKLKNVKIPYHVIDYSDNRFTDSERRYLERQLRSMFAFVGCAIPDKIKYGDAEIPLREVVWMLLTKDNLSPDELEIAGKLIPVLEKNLKADRKMLASYSLTDEEAEKLYFEACGMLKAIVTLRGLESNRTTRPDEAIRVEKVKDAKRLLELLERIK
jgi:hypothetical protein